MTSSATRVGLPLPTTASLATMLSSSSSSSSSSLPSSSAAQPDTGAAGVATASPRTNPTTTTASGLLGQSRAAVLLRAKDWTSCPLGPIEQWPASLRSLVNMVLEAHSPFQVFWGEQLVVFANDTAVRALGEHVLGEPLRRCLPELVSTVEPMVTKAMQDSGKATWCSVDSVPAFLRNDGVQDNIRLIYVPLSDDKGDYGGLLAPLFDETKRIMLQRRLTTLRNMDKCGTGSRSLIEASNACMDVINGASRSDIPYAALYKLSDDKAKLLLLATSRSLLNNPAVPSSILVVDNGDDSALSQPSKQALATGNVVHIPGINFVDGYGGCVVCPLINREAGSCMGILLMGVVLTITSSKFDESSILFCGLIASQIATAFSNAITLEGERLHAEKLMHLDKAKTTFFANVSHEFRTPLTLIEGPLLDVLNDKRCPVSIAHRHQLTIVWRNTERLLKLVNSLLDFSRIESQASFVPVDLAKLTTDFASSFRSTIENGGLQYVVECERLGEPVYVDVDMWEKIVLNLLSNAFKFTMQGSIHLSLRRIDWWSPPTTQGSSDAPVNSPIPAVVLAITDTGCGIRREHIPRLFERFYRVMGTTGRSCEGTGIGLALTAELAKLHGGNVSIMSEYGKGSTFSVVIPLGRDHLPQDRIMPSASFTSSNRSLKDEGFVLDEPSTENLADSPFVQEAAQWNSSMVISPPPTDLRSAATTSSSSSSLSSIEGELAPPVAPRTSPMNQSAGDDKPPATELNPPPAPPPPPLKETQTQPAGVTSSTRGPVYPTDVGEMAIHWIDDIPVVEHLADTSSLDIPLFTGSLHNALAQLTVNTRQLVLLADDNADMRSYIQSILARDYNVVAVANGQQALDYIQTCQQDGSIPDVVLSDVMMPQVDGFQLVRQLRRNRHAWNVPIILLSGRVGEEARVSGLQAGADDFLNKPFSARELLARIQTQIKLSKTRQYLEGLVKSQTKALIESKNLYRTLTIFSPVGVLRTDERGRLVYATNAFLQVLGLEGLSVAEVVHWRDHVHPDDKVHFEEIRLAMWKRGVRGVVRYEFRYVRPTDGKTVWIFAQSRLEFDNNNNEITAEIMALSDVTDQKLLENERIHAFASAQAEARDRAAESEEHRRRQELFVDMVCHEIRNPLNGIVNCIDLMQTNMDKRNQLINSLPPSHARDAIQALAQDDVNLLGSVDVCMNHQRKITDDVLNLSKLSSGNMTLNLEVLEPLELLKAIVGMFEGQARSNKLELTFECPSCQDAPSYQSLAIRSDPYRLSQIIINLISNAIKFTANSAVRRVTVRLMYSATPPSAFAEAVMNRDSLLPSSPDAHIQATAGGGAVASTALPLKSTDSQSHLSTSLQAQPQQQDKEPVDLKASALVKFVSAHMPRQSVHLMQRHNTGSSSSSSGGGSSIASSSLSTDVGLQLPPRYRSASLDETAATKESTKDLLQRRTQSADVHVASTLVELPVPPTPATEDNQQPARQSAGSVDVEPPRQEEKEHQFMIVSVEDTGVGMNKDEITSLFQRFRQANPKTYSRYGGTGLGLYITKMLVDLMGGMITVASEPMQGSTFRVTLPIETVTAAPTQLESLAMRQREARILSTTAAPELRLLKQDLAMTSLGTSVAAPDPTADSANAGKHRRLPVVEEDKSMLHILVVEDNMINQQLLRRQLEVTPALKCSTSAAGTGAQAIQQCIATQFDLVLMDVEMPEMGGLEATRAIRAMESARGRRPVPIIGLSGNARDVHVQAAIDAGMDEYMAKPYTKDQLIQLIVKLLGQKK